MSPLQRVLGALLFASDKPISAAECVKYLKGAVEAVPEDAEVAALAKTKQDAVAEALRELGAEYEEQQRGFRLVESGSGWKAVTAPDAVPWVRQLFPENRPARLSPSALETLAIVAYRQPITRAEIEDVRGVAVNPNIIRTLSERGWIRVVGHREVPGRPELLGTTRDFLDYFGLKSLDQLPTLAELRDMDNVGVQLEFGEPSTGQAGTSEADEPEMAAADGMELEAANDPDATTA